VGRRPGEGKTGACRKERGLEEEETRAM
jgi:hypothetical protein